MRTYACCNQSFNFAEGLGELESTPGCVCKFHIPTKISLKAAKLSKDYQALIPAKYMVIKDDTPGDPINAAKDKENNLVCLPKGNNFEIPMSLNAETCVSQFRNVEKEQKEDK